MGFEVYLCLDIAHYYIAGNDLHKLLEYVKNDVTQLIHLNNVPENIAFGGNHDRHEKLYKGKLDKKLLQEII